MRSLLAAQVDPAAEVHISSMLGALEVAHVDIQPVLAHPVRSVDSVEFSPT